MRFETFCLAPFRPQASTRFEEALEPDLPEGVDFVNLASPSLYGAPFSLVACAAPPKALGPACEPVPESLQGLLRSALGYPPALALARECFHWRLGPPASPTAFPDEYAAVLHHYLEAQPHSPFFLGRVGDEDPSAGYCWSGEYVWLVGFKAERGEVGWVSRDFWIHWDRLQGFDMDRRRLEALPSRFPAPPWFRR